MHTIDVIIPVYNGERTLARAVQSVLQCERARAILVDDGSTDGTARLCDTLADVRVRVIHRENGGASAARNTGLDAAEAPFVAFLDADDAFIPGALDALLDRMGPWDALQGRVVRRSVPVDQDAPIDPLTLEQALQNPTRHLLCHGWVFRREKLAARFDESLSLGEDGEWLLRVMQGGLRAGRMDTPAYRYTLRRSSALRTAGDVEMRYLATLQCAQKSLDEANLPQAAALYRLTHLLLILTHGHADLPSTRRLCQTEPFRTDLRSVRLKGKSPRMLTLKLLQKGHCRLGLAAVRIRRRINAWHTRNT